MGRGGGRNAAGIIEEVVVVDGTRSRVRSMEVERDFIIRVVGLVLEGILPVFSNGYHVWRGRRLYTALGEGYAASGRTIIASLGTCIGIGIEMFGFSAWTGAWRASRVAVEVRLTTTVTVGRGWCEGRD